MSALFSTATPEQRKFGNRYSNVALLLALPLSILLMLGAYQVVTLPPHVGFIVLCVTTVLAPVGLYGTMRSWGFPRFWALLVLAVTVAALYPVAQDLAHHSLAQQLAHVTS